MNKEMYERLLSTMIVQSATGKEELMMAYIEEQVKSIDGVSGYHYDKKGNMYVTKGDAEVYPCVVSHTDTVHAIYKDFKIFKDGDVLFAWDGDTNQQVGIGGDDKVGVFITLEALRKFDNVKVAFFVEEESGCTGSREAEMEWFEDVAFVLQCDRKGNSDFVTGTWGTELSSKEFQKAIKKTIKKFGYSFSDGGLTDAVELKEQGLEVCSANMCCGYYEPHTKGEYIKVSEVLNCLDMVLLLCDKFGDRKWEHKHENKYSYPDYSDNWGGGYSGLNGYSNRSRKIGGNTFGSNKGHSWVSGEGWKKNTVVPTKTVTQAGGLGLSVETNAYTYEALAKLIDKFAKTMTDPNDLWDWRAPTGNTIWEEMRISEAADAITKFQSGLLVELMYGVYDDDDVVNVAKPLSDIVEQKENFIDSSTPLRYGVCNICEEGNTVKIDDTIDQAYCSRCMCYLTEGEFEEISNS